MVPAASCNYWAAATLWTYILLLQAQSRTEKCEISINEIKGGDLDRYDNINSCQEKLKAFMPSL